MESIMSKPIKIGNVELKNRFMIPAVTLNFCENGHVTDKLIGNYEARAKGGFGAIIVEGTMIDENVQFSPYAAAFWNDSFIEDQAKLVNAIKKHGTVAFLQLNHNGRELVVKPGEEYKNVGPSPIADPTVQVIPHELTIEEIHELENYFSDAALRAKKAGYDGIELHGAHGYLIGEFMSPYANKRIDEYGGSIDNRLRFPLNIIKNIKEKCGQDFPLIFRLSVDEFVPGGLKLAESKLICKILEQNGVDAIDISSSVYESMVHYEPPMNLPYCTLEDYGKAIKEVVHIPVAVVGRITDPRMAENMVESNQCDIAVMGRASIADPELPNKFFEGKCDTIRQCLSCNQGCAELCTKGLPIACMTNPHVGYEYLDETKEATVKKKVEIVGAGVAGILAAEGAAMRGHSVTIYEKGQLGGAFAAANVPPEKGQLSNLLSWHIAKIKELGVKIILNTEYTKEMYNTNKPDKLIIASGTKDSIPPIKGIEGNNIVHAVDILMGRKTVGNKVVVAGGGLVGAETAAYLAQYGKNVTVVEMMDEIAKEEETTRKTCLFELLKKGNVTLMPNTRIKEFTDHSVIVNDNEELVCDSVVLALGVKDERSLYDQLKDNDNVVIVGHNNAPKNALTALRQGFEAGINA